MVKNFAKRLLPVLLAVMMVVCAIPMSVSATTVTVLNGDVSITDKANSMNESSGVVTVTAKGGFSEQTTNTITIVNNSGNTATLSFDYSASNYKSFSESSESGSYSVLLASGRSITMSITGKFSFSTTTATLTLSNFALTAAAASSEVTFLYDETLGSVTVNGEAVTNNGALDIASSTGATLTATTASSSVSFLGWINMSNNTILSTNATFDYLPSEEYEVVKAAFTGSGSDAYFHVGGTYLFDDLNTAVDFAGTASSKTIVLANNGTLPAGDYEIPSGITLLVPYNADNSLCTTAPDLYPSANSYSVTPTAYRTLTIASGANISVNGAISVSAQTNASGGNKPGAGSPVGPCGFIDMKSGSTITINSGANLYAWGFITGEGTITAKKDSDVYENFQMQDFRGGDQLSNMENRVFPMSQYYVQNIEVALTLEAGASEHSYTAINASIIGNQATSVEFISNSGAMFNLTSGSVTKRYDGSTDRLIIEANGDMTISPITMSIRAGIVATNINSEDYVLPINSNITVKVNSGTIKIEQDVALLPGAEIIIEENAICELGAGNKAYAYDSAEWGNYCAPSNKKLIPVQYAPSKTYTRTEADLKDALILINGTLNASAGYIYTTAGGANVYSTKNGVVNVTEGTDTVTYQVTQAAEPSDSVYTEIPITPAKLKNADGSYVSTTTGTYNYNSDHGKWANGEHIFADSVVSPTCTEQGYTRHTCACGYYYDDTYVAATGHSYGEWVVDKAATHSEEGSRSRYCLTCTTETQTEPIPVIICDYDGDGLVNGVELAMMRKYLLELETPDEKATILFDMDDNGEIDIKDLVRLKKYIAGIA